MDSEDELRTLAHRRITADALPTIRADTTAAAQGAGLDAERAEKFAFAVHEMATNTVDHADGTGELTLIQDDETVLYAEVADHGPGFDQAAAGTKPSPEAFRGRGLWLSQAMTDRMHVDSDPDGTVVYLEMSLDDDPDAPPRPSDKKV